MIPHREWPHAPPHRWNPGATYIITGATLAKAHFIKSASHLSAVRNCLFELAEQRAWTLHAWAILINHYHFIADAPEHLAEADEKKAMISGFIRGLHSKAAIAVNKLDGVSGRRVFYEYWDAELTYQESYFARLHYVHANPEKHGVVTRAEDYPWCSMSWFKTQGRPSFVKSILSFKTDDLNVEDDFE
jgi:putative transposase